MTRRANLLSLVLAITLAAGSLASWSVPAAAADAREYKVKAALLYQITRMVEWPDSALVEEKETLRIGVLDPDPFGDALARAVAGRPGPFGNGIEVVRIDSIDDALACHVLFVPRNPDPDVLQALPELRRAAVLLVGEETGFAERDGGIIALVPNGRTMSMVLNLEALTDSGLHARSRFLRLCRIVGDGAR